jgi:hypothetical protein
MNEQVQSFLLGLIETDTWDEIKWIEVALMVAQTHQRRRYFASFINSRSWERTLCRTASENHLGRRGRTTSHCDHRGASPDNPNAFIVKISTGREPQTAPFRCAAQCSIARAGSISQQPIRVRAPCGQLGNDPVFALRSCVCNRVACALDDLVWFALQLSGHPRLPIVNDHWILLAARAPGFLALSVALIAWRFRKKRW